MSNIHRLSDIERNRNQNYLPVNNGSNMNQNIIPMLSLNPLNNPTNPRKENFCLFLKITCCPTFTFFSFIFIICVIDIIFFAIELIKSSEIYGEFLQPDFGTLMDLGAKYPYNMKKGYIWLFITPILLHANFLHIFGNIFSTLIFGMTFESAVGLLRTIAIYLLSGIGGNLFSALVSDNLSVGASSCIMGIMAGQLVFFILNWDALRNLGSLRYQMIFLLGLIILINLFMGLGSSSLIDNYGHLGGFLAGTFASFSLIKPIEITGREERLKKVNIILLFAYFTIGFILFYTIRHPSEFIILNE